MNCPSDNVVLKNTQTVHNGFLKLKKVQLQHRLFSGEMSPEFQRELVQRAAAVAVLLYDPENDRVVLLEQFRVGCLAEENPWCIEVCAGLVDAGETEEEAARREVLEEADCEVEELILVSRFYPSPGACDEVITLYCGLLKDAPTESRIHGVDGENEDIRTLPLSGEEAEALLLEGKVNNATALIALQWLWRYRREIGK